MLCLGFRVRTSKPTNSPATADHLPRRRTCAGTTGFSRNVVMGETLRFSVPGG
jgi:hypothetical protein